MTAQPAHEGPVPFLVPPEKNLRAIRVALLPEYHPDFDRQFRQVMADATETLDLSLITDFIEHWWRLARLCGDPARHRSAMDKAARLERGEHVPTLSRAETMARLGL
ncbi:hypothetical protein GCM10009555_083490 [Acrocarpospora macrocephala]|uniref:Uncharacterized protein n=1 Tax=Acrocarpospora macrocephala TaxID=150177 RepID=A0A5M3X3V5_9ACTN|nr:DUF6247 family protein [Acrocarpospora macrocephala]GES15332.1 hypothetical protein Amac_089290 [Acrocarpospora macrocephala]